MWAIKFGDQLIFIGSTLFQIFVIFICFKNKNDQIPNKHNINDESESELISQEQTQVYTDVVISKELQVFNSIELLNWAWRYFKSGLWKQFDCIVCMILESKYQLYV